MHARRKRRPHPMLLCAVIAAALVLCALLAWLFWPKAAPALASAKPVEGSVKGLALSMGAQDDFAALSTEDAQRAWLADAADFAAQSGMNALFVQVYAPHAGEDGAPAVLYRDRAYPVLPNIGANDTFFHKFDPLRTLCELAAEKGLSVYACLPVAEDGRADKTLQQSIAHLRKKYAVADVMFQNESTAALGTYENMDGTVQVAYTAPACWTDPSALFTASVQADFSGAVVQDIALAKEFPDVLRQMAASLAGGSAPQLAGYAPDGLLTVGYPAQNAAMYTQNVYVMGTSDPNEPLTVNGAPVERPGTQGVFGTLVTLAEGENVFTFLNGSQTASLTLQYNPPKASSGGKKTVPQDSTEAVEPGTYVRTTGWISSLLYDPSSDDKISETVRRGAVARVRDCVETTRKGKRTWAYQLESGDFVLAYNTETLGKDYGNANYTSALAQQTANGETVLFAGSGTPLAYTNTVDNTLVLHFYNADFAPDFTVQGSGMIQSTKVTAQENFTEVVFTFTAPLWGHTLEYENGAVMLHLKKAPMQSDVFAKPLTGVSILLDAGHGADDLGAMGAAGAKGPAEKDVNLAVTLAAKYRLEQLGATVHTVRTDDTFLTLEQRNALISQLQPDFFIAVHHNSQELVSDAAQNSGVECYYFYDSGKTLAQNLVQRLTVSLGRADRGAQWGYYYVTRNTTCPAVLLEVGFMVNPAEYEKVASTDSYWRTGDAIAQSILACVPKA